MLRWLTLGEAAEISKHFPTLSKQSKNATSHEAKCLTVSASSSYHLAASEAQCPTAMGQIVTRPIRSDAAHPKETS